MLQILDKLIDLVISVASGLLVLVIYQRMKR